MLGETLMVGDASLWQQDKIAFFSSRHINVSQVALSYQWVESVCASGGCVMGGFQSELEREVLKRLLSGGAKSVVLVLAHKLWSVVPTQYRDAVNSGRLLIVSPVSQNLVRASKESCLERNRFVLENCCEAFFASLDPNGSLKKLVDSMPSLKWSVIN